MSGVLSYIIVISAALLSVLILIQARGASLGAGFGGSGEIHTTRRGVDKSLHQTTILVAIIFVGSIVANIIFGA